jgi:hypothetical protein
MKIVRVTYTAKSEYVAQNQLNIQAVMAELRKNNHPGINYQACLGSDGKSFTHLAFFNTPQDEKHLLDLPVFHHFQAELKAKGLETPPKQELLTLVGSSVDPVH